MASGVAEVDVKLNLPDIKEIEQQYGPNIATLLMTVFANGVLSGEAMFRVGQQCAEKAFAAGACSFKEDTLVNGSPENEGQDDAR